MKCPYCQEFKGNGKVRGYPVSDQLRRHIEVAHKTMANRLWLVSPLAQNAEVTKYCFQECGQILVGGVTLYDAPFFPCRTEICPYEDKVADLGIAELDRGKEHVIVRRLKPSP